ncbi:MAG: DUF1987 domain-containing protein [Spirochaetales bacterium]|nr:DUF1987 domain-containing protein [Spirochaetales bacterium]
MVHLNIDKKKSTPGIVFKPEERTLHIEGESYPENATAFYRPVIEWINNYLHSSEEGLDLMIKLLYINTSSSKALLVLFDMLEDAHKKGLASHVHWLYDEENKLAGEIGEDLSDGLSLPFSIEPVL